MALKDLSKPQLNFLILTTESGSPWHPFVKSLRRLLELPELVDDDKRGSKRGHYVAANASDMEVVLHHHSHPDEQGPIYEQRKPAIDALMKDLTW